MTMAAELPEPDPTAEGLRLARLYGRAAAEVMAREALDDDQSDESLRVALAYYDARDDLVEFIERHGPVETPAGLYKIAGTGQLAFRRHPDPGLIEEALCN